VTAVSRPSTPSAKGGFVEDYAAAVERFAVAVGWSDLRNPVATCPGWSVRDLVVHLGNVHAWAATIVETGQRAAEHNDEPRSHKPRAVSEWYFAKAEDLYQVLRQTPSDKPCWNFAFGSGLVAFWQRRQLHETTIHQLDLDLAAGRQTQVSARVAADGVDEVLTVMLPRMVGRGCPPALTAPLQLTATDTGDSWVVTPASAPAPGEAPGAQATSPVPPSVTYSTGVADAAHEGVMAPAEVIYRALWHRRFDEEALRVAGNESRVRGFLASRLTP
jgi:uncharacterized protein (TIGR03083 family)